MTMNILFRYSMHDTNTIVYAQVPESYENCQQIGDTSFYGISQDNPGFINALFINTIERN